MAREPGYRRHSSGNARVSINGRDYMLGKYASKESKQKYNRLKAEWYASNQSKSFGVPEDEITINEILVAYLKFARKYYGEGSNHVLRQLKPSVSALRELYGSEPAASYGPLQFKATREHISRIGDRTRTYVNLLCDKIRRIFRWAASESLIPSSIPEALSTVDGLQAGRTKLRETEDVEPIDIAIVAKTLEKMHKITGDMVRFQLATGCRPGEVCKIKPNMVDRSNDVWEIKLVKHKTAWKGKKRVIYVGKSAQEILLPYLLRGADDYCFSPKESERARLQAAKESRTTPSRHIPGKRKRKPKRSPGECYSSLSYARAIASACDRAFPPPETMKSESEIAAWKSANRWAPNRLRHTFATKTTKEHDIIVASLLCGHSSVETTKIYAKADKEKAIAAVRAMG